MRFRNRVLVTSILLVWVPLLVLTFIIRREMSDRLTAEHGRRVETLLAVFEQDIEDRTQDIRTRLADLKGEIREDNRFRLVAVEGLAVERAYVLDYAGRAMRLLGFSMLQIQDADGRILSSGHFRNEYDRVELELPRLVAASPTGYALLSARTPAGSELALACVDSVSLGGESFTLVGGVTVQSSFLSALAPDSTLAVSLVYPGGVVSSQDDLAARLNQVVLEKGETWEEAFPATDFLLRWSSIPFVSESDAGANAGDVTQAALVATYPRASLREILRSLDIWLGMVILITILGTTVLSLWISARMSRPLVALAEKTVGIDLDRLDADFESERSDEVGDLSRFLAAMTRRLKAGTIKLKEAERRAALGDLARQVNHDVRNGLTPIRNVFRHLNEVAKEDPERIEAVFRERAGVLDSSIGYLEGLAENYARLYRNSPRKPCDLNSVVHEAASARGGVSGTTITLDLDREIPAVLADPIALRRIVDNLITNAEESLDREGVITLQTFSSRRDDESPAATLVVTDTGSGIPAEILEKIFDDFYTTKERGAGLGLSIVRRLVADSGGSIRADSEVGKGTRFTVELPTLGADHSTPPDAARGDHR